MSLLIVATPYLFHEHVIPLSDIQTYKRDDILQKRPRIVMGLLIVATPYLFHEHVITLSDIHTYTTDIYKYTPVSLSYTAYCIVRVIQSHSPISNLQSRSRETLLQMRPIILRSLLIVATSVSFANETYHFKEPTNRSHLSNLDLASLFSMESVAKDLED